MDIEINIKSTSERSDSINESSKADMNVVKEGSATVKIPKTVFYNPVQEFNRDLTIAVINHFNTITQTESKPKGGFAKEGLRILEALSATGLRSIRFANELNNVGQIIANDLDPTATKLIEENIADNKLDHKIKVSCGDANFVMYKSNSEEKRFHVIDLDPYGSAARFLDSAVQGLEAGGLLCVTCTDAAVLCGAASGTSMGKYGSVTLGCSRLAASHELGIRVLLHAIQTSAGRYALVIEPLLSLSVDFYFRVFVRVRPAPKEVKAIAAKLGMVWSCVGCQTFHLQPLGTVEPRPGNNVKVAPAHGPTVGSHCDQCGSGFVLGGPFWNAPIHCQSFCKGLVSWLTASSETNKRMPGTLKRIVGMVSLAAEELPESPLFYELDRLCKILRSIMPPQRQVRSALLHGGYRVSASHCNPNSLKTNAPPSFLWTLLCAHQHKNDPDRISSLLAGDKLQSAGRMILQRRDLKAESLIDFSPHRDADSASRSQKLLRFQPNPTPNWGPKPKAARIE